MRGYAVIALDNPKSGENVGGVMRAAGVYGAAMVIVTGQRFKTLKKFPTDTMQAWKHVPVIEVDDMFDVMPDGCVPIAVEIVSGARLLPKYTHPERAVYIFGAEDQTLGHRILCRCQDVIMIPTKRCMNLAATANVILYDRMAKCKDWPIRSEATDGS